MVDFHMWRTRPYPWMFLLQERNLAIGFSRRLNAAGEGDEGSQPSCQNCMPANRSHSMREPT